ncbi:TIGR01212 family radical SAM protein [Shewanella sp. C32]|uniref:TIGR01212 family radical SAM protein n=1 Tax=Shewanella electrica TaxID=515560 RepID=A0ABT2FG83_9GAMM|nr:TIGR01212 family radical SAM protein [Shewanella electrica]MCH1925396.1 TIGR01212 family radical SAM protein [Shewanella electrica]MCS4555221.1 TIGR01212 family radical SAM protein [Shewanella electrica]
MGLDKFVYTFGRYCQQQFGQRVQKLTLDAKFTCPNRDGTLGVGGCTFCNVASFSYAANTDASLTIAEQLHGGKQRLREKAEKFLAYFQAYTSTYEEYSLLKRRYDEALKSADLVGLCVGTRPDCVPDSVLQLLAQYQQQGFEVWLELGLQSAHDQTLRRINRGHDFAAYQDAVTRARNLGLKVCTHLILGLPSETALAHQQTLERVLDVGVDGLKLHPLHIVEGSVMAKAWRAGRLQPLTIEEYAATATNLIRRTPTSVVYHRVTAYAKPPILLAPQWCCGRWTGLTAVVDNLARLGGQGSLIR